MEEDKKIKKVETVEVEQSDPMLELKSSIDRLANAYTVKNVMLRGILNGMLAGIGAILGVAMFIVIATQIKGFPLIKDFMEVTGLDIVVEYALEQTKSDVDVSDTYFFNDENLNPSE